MYWKEKMGLIKNVYYQIAQQLYLETTRSYVAYPFQNITDSILASIARNLSASSFFFLTSSPKIILYSSQITRLDSNENFLKLNWFSNIYLSILRMVILVLGLLSACTTECSSDIRFRKQNFFRISPLPALTRCSKVKVVPPFKVNLLSPNPTVKGVVSPLQTFIHALFSFPNVSQHQNLFFLSLISSTSLMQFLTLTPNSYKT